MTTGYLKIFIEKRKNDQLSEGIREILAKGKGVSCAFRLNNFLRYFSAAEVNMLSSDFNIKPVV